MTSSLVIVLYKLYTNMMLKRINTECTKYTNSCVVCFYITMRPQVVNSLILKMKDICVSFFINVFIPEKGPYKECAVFYPIQYEH